MTLTFLNPCEQYQIYVITEVLCVDSIKVYLIIDKRGCIKYTQAQSPQEPAECFDDTERVAEFVAAVLREDGERALSLPVFEVGSE